MTNSLTAARLWVFARVKGNCSEEDVRVLAQLIDEFSLSAYLLALEQCQDIYRQIHSGGCRLLSQGDGGCHCFLCQLDTKKKEIAQIRESMSPHGG